MEPSSFSTSLRSSRPYSLAPLKSGALLIRAHERRRRSFESLSNWLSDARALASPDLEVVIVGNKLDQEDDRQVPYLEASRWAQEHGES